MTSAAFYRRIQQVSAVLETRCLLQRIADPKQTPRVPRSVRAEARALLRWFPPPDVLRTALEGQLGTGAKGREQG